MKTQLYVEQLYPELLRTLVNIMSPKMSRSILQKYRHIEKHHGVKYLLDTMNMLKTSLLDLHGKHSRAYMLKDKAFLRSPFKREFLHFYNVSLRRNGLALALNAIVTGGLFVAKEAGYRDYITLQRKLAEKKDPFCDIDSDGIPIRPLLKDSLYRNKIASVLGIDLDNMVFKHEMQKYITERYITPYENDIFFTYPFDEKLQVIRKDTFMRGMDVTPQDLIEQLYLFPSLVFDEYDYFAYLVGDLMPPKESFSGNSPVNDIGGYVSILNKDRKLKKRPINAIVAMLQLAISPLHNRCKAILKNIPSCYCFNQDAGVAAAESLLNEYPDELFCCLDIDSATDNISATLMTALGELILPMDLPFRESILSCFARMCSMKLLLPPHVKVPKHLKRSDIFVRHFLGSPMGGLFSYYSMAFFFINELMHVRCPVNKTLDIGDDLAFSYAYYQPLRNILDICHIPISWHKSILGSNSLIEICGRLVRPQGMIGFFKAKAFERNNPIPSTRRFGVNPINRFRLMLHKSDRDKLDMANLKDLTARYRKGLIPPQISRDLQIGGYTLRQQKKLGIISEHEYAAMVYLIGVTNSIGRHLDVDLNDFCNRKLILKKPKRITNKHGVIQKVHINETLYLSQSLPYYANYGDDITLTLDGYSKHRTGASFLGIDPKPGDILPIPTTVSELLTINLDYLAKKAFREIKHLDNFQPAFNTRWQRDSYNLKALFSASYLPDQSWEMLKSIYKDLSYFQSSLYTISHDNAVTLNDLVPLMIVGGNVVEYNLDAQDNTKPMARLLLSSPHLLGLYDALAIKYLKVVNGVKTQYYMRDEYGNRLDILDKPFIRQAPLLSSVLKEGEDFVSEIAYLVPILTAFTSGLLSVNDMNYLLQLFYQ